MEAHLVAAAAGRRATVNHRGLHGTVILVALITLSSCGDAGPAGEPGATASADATFTLSESQRALRAAAAEAAILNAAINRFLTRPDEPNRESAIAAWHTAHDAWLQAWGAAALISGPNARSVAFQIDAWPVTPGFLDTLPEYPHAGMVADIALTLDPESVRTQHGFSDVSEVALGFHAIELLLTTRPLEDFSAESELKRRRQTLLRLQGDLLLADVKALAATPLPATADERMVLRTAITTLSAALRSVSARDTERRRHASRGDAVRAAQLISASVTGWLEHDVLRRWLQVTQPQATASLFETLQMLQPDPTVSSPVSTAGPDSAATSAGSSTSAASDVAPDTDTAPNPGNNRSEAPGVRIELALRAALQILEEVRKAGGAS